MITIALYISERPMDWESVEFALTLLALSGVVVGAVAAWVSESAKTRDYHRHMDMLIEMRLDLERTRYDLDRLIEQVTELSQEE